MEMKKVLKYAMEIGECMLVSGAGVSSIYPESMSLKQMNL